MFSFYTSFGDIIYSMCILPNWYILACFYQFCHCAIHFIFIEHMFIEVRTYAMRDYCNRCWGYSDNKMWFLTLNSPQLSLVVRQFKQENPVMEGSTRCYGNMPKEMHIYMHLRLGMWIPGLEEQVRTWTLEPEWFWGFTSFLCDLC